MCILLGLLFKHRALEKQWILCDADLSAADRLNTRLGSLAAWLLCVPTTTSRLLRVSLCVDVTADDIKGTQRAKSESLYQTPSNVVDM